MDSPLDSLQKALENFKINDSKIKLDSEEFSECMDEADQLRKYRSKFQFPLLGTLPIGELLHSELKCIHKYLSLQKTIDQKDAKGTLNLPVFTSVATVLV